MKKNIIILGAGFGGITVALKIARRLGNHGNEYDIVLVDRNPHHLYTSGLYEIASIPHKSVSDPNLKTSILIPIHEIISGTRIIFWKDELVLLHHEQNIVTLKERGNISYTFLILSLGSETNYFDIPGLQERSFPLKTFNDAIRLRNTIEQAVLNTKTMSIVVGGAGSSGVELVAEFINFVCNLRDNILGTGSRCQIQFTLVEASAEILPGFDAWIVEKTKKRLLALGILIKTSAPITHVNEKEIMFKNGAAMPYDILIWTGGVKGPALLQHTHLSLSNKGSCVVNEFLQTDAAGGNVFAIGDNSTYTNPRTGKPLVWNIPVAEAEGRLVANNIIRLIEGKPKKAFIPMKQYPFVLAVGKKYAIADLVYIRFWGFWGWFTKQLVELRYLLFILPPRNAFATWLKGIKYFTSND